MYNYLKYKILKKTFILLVFIGCLKSAQAQTENQSDSLLQTLLVEEKVDTQLLAPSKMLFTQQLIWGNHGILKNRYGATEDLVERRKIDLRIRRKMLQLHQIGGFVTLGGMVAQGIIGSQLYNGNYGLKETHEKLGMAVNLSYGFTAINGLFPPPSSFKRDKKLTSIRLHKWLAVAHLSGMLATNILASQIDKNYALKPYHRAAAYTSFFSLAAAMVVIKF
jgi:hypothetical protein